MWRLIILERTGRIETVYSHLGHCTVHFYESELHLQSSSLLERHYLMSKDESFCTKDSKGVMNVLS